MENLSKECTKQILGTNTKGKTVAEILVVPFDPFKLLRPLRVFKTALGLTPGMAGPPDPEFLCILIDGTRHQAQLRSALKSQYKNMENMVRGRHVPLTGTAGNVQSALGVDAGVMQQLMHRNSDGPLMPMYLTSLQMLEGVYMKCYHGLASAVLTCPCCKSNMLDDMDAWWGCKTLTLEPNAYAFVDRLLKAIVGAGLLMSLLKLESSIAPHVLKQLIDPAIHPMGQWMELVRSEYGLPHLWQITRMAGVAADGEGSVSDAKIRKWKCGIDLLPLTKARLMIKDCVHYSTLNQALLAARVFALALDVVQSTAAGDGYPSREIAQSVVAKRFAKLNENLRLSLLLHDQRLKPLVT